MFQLAIIDYLEDTVPVPSVIPKDPVKKAKVIDYTRLQSMIFMSAWDQIYCCGIGIFFLYQIQNEQIKMQVLYLYHRHQVGYFVLKITKKQSLWLSQVLTVLTGVWKNICRLREQDKYSLLISITINFNIFLYVRPHFSNLSLSMIP